jgi:hypothetical protein
MIDWTKSGPVLLADVSEHPRGQDPPVAARGQGSRGRGARHRACRQAGGAIGGYVPPVKERTLETARGQIWIAPDFDEADELITRLFEEGE